MHLRCRKDTPTSKHKFKARKYTGSHAGEGDLTGFQNAALKNVAQSARRRSQGSAVGCADKCLRAVCKCELKAAFWVGTW